MTARRGGKEWQKKRSRIIEFYGRRCHLCGRKIEGKITMDHLRLKSKGGTEAFKNLRPAHRKCNHRRGNKSIAAFRRKYAV